MSERIGVQETPAPPFLDERVGRIGIEVPSIPSDLPVPEVDELFRLDSDLRAVAVFDPVSGARSLLTRHHLASRLSGRLGYGRALHARSTAGEVLEGPSTVLDEGTTLEHAAALVLGRPETTRYDDLLVIGADAARVVTVSQIFERLSASFRHMAWHDALTGLPNLRWLSERGGSVLASADPARTALLYIDLDNFKPVNDTYGHDAGNEVLVQFGHRLAGCLRAADFAARLGGDEFIVLLTDVGSSDAQGVAQRVLEVAQLPFYHDGHTIRLSASIGLAMGVDVPADEKLGPLDALLRQADGAMLASKRSGKRSLQRATGEGNNLSRVAKIRRRLLNALEEDALSVLYEPELDLESGTCRVVQATMRWVDPELGVLKPREFMPLTGPSGQLVPFGRWMLERVCRQIHEWILSGHHWQTALRAPSGWFMNGTLAADVAAALDAHGIPPARLRIDMIGPLAPPGMPAARKELEKLRELGVDVGLDRFGGDTVPLSVLRSLPLNVLKLDPSLTGRVESDPAEAALVAGIADAARALGIRVAASDVRRAEQLRMLGDLRIQSVTGPVVSTPLAASDVAAALERNMCPRYPDLN
ncbi:hypothetical protein GCM10027405_25350 [Arthrobacter alkaliphilus]|uniref:putative bifunctional diguanylate cyclase/phosphodiesterase n=1 Tax=Arthrobacter alkaliphilus TaxID=369936 RepID=UPI001F175DE7|nr:EAL domain-containing protein [Arthrobacter alkaliphilus]